MSRKPIYNPVISFAPSINVHQLDSPALDRTPFTYYIAWVDEYGSVTACYYGVKFAKGCHPSDFWQTYFTSSRYVKDYRKQHGEPQIIEIRAVFNDVKTARSHEYTVLRRLKVTQSSVWLNDDCGNRSGGMTQQGKLRMKETLLATYGVDHYSKTPEYSHKFKATCLERYGADHPLKTAEGIEKFKAGCNRTLGVDFPMQSPEVRAKRVESYLSTLGVDHPMRSQDVKDEMKLRSVEKYGVDHPSKSESVKRKMSDSAKNRKKLTCPHCSKVIPCNVAHRFHFDNCKLVQPLC